MSARQPRINRIRAPSSHELSRSERKIANRANAGELYYLEMTVSSIVPAIVSTSPVLFRNARRAVLPFRRHCKDMSDLDRAQAKRLVGTKNILDNWQLSQLQI